MGVTVDQRRAADRQGNGAALARAGNSNFDYVVGNCDNGFICVYINTLAWSSKTTPLPTEANPRVVFERLFGMADRPRPQGRDPQERQHPRLGHRGHGAVFGRRWAPDRGSIEYLDTLREVERRIQQAEQQDGEALPSVLTRPVGVPSDLKSTRSSCSILQVLTRRRPTACASSRSSGAREVSTRTYPQIGVDEPHHATSHHQNSPEKLAKLAKINTGVTSLSCSRICSTSSRPRRWRRNAPRIISMVLAWQRPWQPDVHDHTTCRSSSRGGAAQMNGRPQIRNAPSRRRSRTSMPR